MIGLLITLPDSGFTQDISFFKANDSLMFGIRLTNARLDSPLLELGSHAGGKYEFGRSDSLPDEGKNQISPDSVILAHYFRTVKSHFFSVPFDSTIIAYVGMAIYDVNQALNSKNNYIQQQYRTPDMISDIVNVVLSGVSNKQNKEVERIGLKIYNDFSKKRFPYLGDIIIRLPGGEILKSIPSLNPKYDPKYGKP